MLWLIAAVTFNKSLSEASSLKMAKYPVKI